MKIVITGSLGHISKPLTEILAGQGHEVTVISSNAERKNEIEALGAKAAIGSLEDVMFLKSAFAGAEIVYCMEPAPNFMNNSINIMDYYNSIVENYSEAIINTGVRKVVHLSSIGGHMSEGNGLLQFHYNAEQILKKLPSDVIIKTMRPVGFYYNLLAYVHAVKAGAPITANYKPTYKEPWVSTDDIAEVIAEEINSDFTERMIRYIASDELTGDEIASVIGTAIGKPDLQWIRISDSEQENKYLSFGMSAQAAAGLTEMNIARESGELFEDYMKHRPVLSKTKLTDFAKIFAAAYNSN